MAAPSTRLNVLSSLTLIAAASIIIPACGSSADSTFTTPGGSSSGNVGPNQNLGGGGGDGGAPQACNQLNATRACCGNGTQKCQGSSEFSTWGPCLDSSGKTLTCNGPGGGTTGGNGNGGGNGGGGGEDGGGNGNGGGGGEDGGGGNGGGGQEDAGPPPPAAPTCNDPFLNTEPDILVAYSPGTGQSVGNGGQVKVWISDECPMIIATGEKVDPNTGVITAAGDRAAMAPDNYPWEPVLYINGTGHYPSTIKGWYNSVTTTVQGGCRSGSTAGAPGTAIDPVPAGSGPMDKYTSEVIWNVSTLGLAPGNYTAEFMVHDGDHERAIGCINIVIN